MSGTMRADLMARYVHDFKEALAPIPFLHSVVPFSTLPYLTLCRIKQAATAGFRWLSRYASKICVPVHRVRNFLALRKQPRQHAQQYHRLNRTPYLPNFGVHRNPLGRFSKLSTFLHNKKNEKCQCAENVGPAKMYVDESFPKAVLKLGI